ncbi:4Fe-4S dicluster domain-containing protein [Lawsonibacter celer]|uniref:4Fe-4S dicluster domain-containing protein n=1 Tax=Lawsonibacter celer TaxID=2986526 RepID=UPI0016448AEA|nr:4Fe-4S dicluster domain-containing protein [Lawsonibacter celer]
MRVFETSVQELKNDVLVAVARQAWKNNLQMGVLDIPEEIIPGPEALMRCCIYKERAIISQRVKVAMGGDQTSPSMVEVLPIACDECPVTEIAVGPACRGCIATRCVHTCPKDAITIVNHRAVIDHSKCISCGRCVSACPYGAIEKHQRPCERSCKAGAISMGEDKKASVDPSKCTSCGACVYQCPFGAIMDKSYIVDTIAMLQGAERWNYRVYAAVAPSIAGQFAPAELGQVVTGLKMLGFHDVVEVALGADMTAKQEAEELVEKGMLASSCCPAFVEFVEKNFPEQAHLISATPSPMVMAARHLKKQDPACKVVFIGPCVAKKKEIKLGKTMGAVDCALTFEELYALFESRDIEVSQLEEAELDQASGFGRSFARSGGVSAAVAEVLKEQGADFTLRPMPCSGLDACRVAFLKAAKGVGDFNFIEGMACEGGCVQGPAQLIRSPKNQGDVDRHAKQAEGRTIAAALECAGESAKVGK